VVLFFVLIPFVVNRTFIAMPTERLQHLTGCYSMYDQVKLLLKRPR